MGRPTGTPTNWCGVLFLCDRTKATPTRSVSEGCAASLADASGWCRGSRKWTMADTVQLTVNKREGSGTLSAKKLRRQGQLPAVVYGHKEETLVVALSHDEFVKALRL